MPAGYEVGFSTEIFMLCRLIVPDEALGKYQSMPGWKNFKTIVALSTGIPTLEADDEAETWHTIDGIEISAPERPGIYLKGRTKVKI